MPARHLLSWWRKVKRTRAAANVIFKWHNGKWIKCNLIWLEACTCNMLIRHYESISFRTFPLVLSLNWVPFLFIEVKVKFRFHDVCVRRLFRAIPHFAASFMQSWFDFIKIHYHHLTNLFTNFCCFKHFRDFNRKHQNQSNDSFAANFADHNRQSVHKLEKMTKLDMKEELINS